MRARREMASSCERLRPLAISAILIRLSAAVLQLPVVKRGTEVAPSRAATERATGNCRRLCTARHHQEKEMIRKLPSGKYRLYSRKTDPRSGKRRNLGTF